MRTGVKRILIASAFALLIGAAFVINYFSGQQIYTGESGDMSSAPTAVNFTVKDKEGNEARLSDYSGKPIVINFWSSWCSPCKSELPVFQQMYEKYGEQVSFLMINLTGGGNDTKIASDKVIAEKGYTFPVFYDDWSSAASAYSIRSMPVTCFITAEGKLAVKNTGALSALKFENLIKLIYS